MYFKKGIQFGLAPAKRRMNLFPSLQNSFVRFMHICPSLIIFDPFKSDFTLSSSSTISRELLSQFSTINVDGDNLMWVKTLRKLPGKIAMQFHGNIHFKTIGCWEIKSVFGNVK